MTSSSGITIVDLIHMVADIGQDALDKRGQIPYDFASTLDVGLPYVSFRYVFAIRKKHRVRFVRVAKRKV